MAVKPLLLPTLLAFLALLASILPHATSGADRYPSPCPSPAGFANYIIRAPLPNSPKLQIKPSFLQEHNLFFYTDRNTLLSQADFASFCLDQCVTYEPDPHPPPFPAEGKPLPESYVTNKTGPCLGFTVDMGKPFPPRGKDTETRWYCEAFDRYLTLDDFEPVDAPESYMYGLGVNRGCGGVYRAY